MSIVYVDLETTGLLASDQIVCAVTKKDGEVVQWAEKEREPAKPFTPELTTRLAEYLVKDDNVIVTFNGLGFDLKFLSDRLSDPVLQRKLASAAIYHHIDIYYCFLTANGYRTNLTSLLSDTTIEKSMTGKEASERVRASHLLCCAKIGSTEYTGTHIPYHFSD